MDLTLTPEDRAFRDEVRAFLAENLTEEMREAGRLTCGPFAEFEYGQRWFETLAKRGWSAPAWPKEYGGPGWTAIQRYIFDVESAAASAPAFSIMGTRMVGPVVMKYGTDEQKQKYLPRILSGEDVWCQGYSEPGSGSDLASLKTRAVRDGDDYVINGSKIWTTFAHHANRMFCLVRTSNEGKPQEGISFVLIDDFDAPGITVEPIILMSGDHDVNQVFFEDVRVPVANRVGPENEGWTVAKYLLEFERGGDTYSPGLHAHIAHLKRVAAAERGDDGGRLIDDPGFRRRIADAECDIIALEHVEKQILCDLAAGRQPGPASSMMKVVGSETLQKAAGLTAEAVGYYAWPDQKPARHVGSNAPAVGPDHAMTALPSHLNHRAATIYGGSNEVQRNIMAKLVLGL
ncbi:acyl-CoA dehydrogenase family protein [Minwuia thermotolerans]|uniref:Acyl-CoA dehydrogenase n=1 Tax=Minwuia thermotolerans TaxID=2056226 RepID=A0A2M9G4W0_9PROT|nr:acyl-CoA dehydrogenase family protein [Minwuia thermotolerans]PJK30748.1 acyl-CoA dehydrogenase [Minwuia thermotolerans]